MAATDRVFLSDRVKELSYSVGTGHFNLEGAAKGFGAFGDFYSYDDAIFYAITDGTDWEVGSGQYFQNGVDNAIKRFPFNSSNNNNKVNFQVGVKEVFVTYPGKFAVFTANGIDEFQSPQSSGIAFWGSQQTLDYDPKLIWDTGTDRLGIGYATPSYQIDVHGENAAWSLIRSSGTIVGESGIMFSGVSPAYAAAYSGGIQLEPFMRNEVDNTTGSDLIFSLSGNVDQRFLLIPQKEGMVWAGPASGDCAGPCADDYPVFRYLIQEDIPDLRELYTRQHNDSLEGSIAFYRISGEIQYDPFLTWDKTNNYLGVGRDTGLTATLDVDGNTSLSGTLDVFNHTNVYDNMAVSGDLVVSGNLDVQGNIQYTNAAIMTILDPQIQLGSLSGTAVYDDIEIDAGGLVVQSTDAAGDKEWIWKQSISAWDTKEGVRASGNVVTSGTLTVARDADFNEDVAVTGTMQASGAVTFWDQFKASGNAIFGSNLLVTDNLEVSGTLSVSGNAIFDGDVTMNKNTILVGKTFYDGDATVSGNLDVSGVSVFNNDVYFTSLAPVVASGTVGVSGAAQFDGELKASGDVIFGADLLVTDNLEVSGTVNTSGNTILDGNLTAQKKLFVTEDSYFIGVTTISGVTNTSGVSVSNNDVYFTSLAPVVASGTVGISGITTLDGNLIAQKKVFVTEDSYFLDTVTVSGAIGVSGAAQFDDTIDASGDVILGNDLWVTNNITASGSAGISGVTTLDGNLVAQKKVFVTEDSYFIGATTASGTVGVSGAAQFDGTIDASGDVTLGNDLWVTNNTTVSGDFHVSGVSVLNSGLNTYSGGLGVFEPNVVINASGFVTIPIFQSATDLTNTLPVAEWTSGAIMFIHDNPNKAMAFCDGYAWSSGHFETV